MSTAHPSRCARCAVPVSTAAALTLVALALGAGAAAADPGAKDAEAAGRPSPFLDAIPPGWSLHACDDCGVLERQPHFDMADSYVWTFQTSDTDADLKSRSAIFSYKAVNATFRDLDPARSYVLAVTYASDHVYKRVQSLWADGVELHGPYALPMAKAVRLIVPVPRAVTADGAMSLRWRIHGEVNATVSIVELWADGPPRGDSLRIADAFGLFADLEGQVLDLAWEPVAGAEVEAARPGGSRPLAAARSGPDGRFRLPLAFEGGPTGDLRITAREGGRAVTAAVPADRLSFDPVRYRPIPAAVAGLADFRLSLDGTWRLHPSPGPSARPTPLDAPGWIDFAVPGQWRQAGLEIPADRTVAMAREFEVPAEWTGRRVFLRFDAVHAGTRYRLNGEPLGSSENLFTPVEWELTKGIRFGARNRLDLEMKVDTVSERLSSSSGYAFHSLGGIDRSVSVYALPEAHVRALRVEADFDPASGAGELRAAVTVQDGRSKPGPLLQVAASIEGPDGQPVALSGARDRADLPGPDENVAELSFRAPSVRPWSAEKPVLYTLRVDLRSGDKGQPLIERIERRVGFRRVEVRGSRLLLNGVPVKLAGACHHETDPLTGRAATARHAEEDVRLFRGANLNYLRTSHYPPTLELVEAADRLGLYLEVEAPFCWVGPEDGLAHVREVLAPTSAMVDLYGSHPSVIVWSLANESEFNRSFEVSAAMVKRLDPTRPTTFNNPDPKRICDIANLHYPPMPYDGQAKGDPRPLFLGEYWFPVCHEQTDVRIDPGLREFFGFGHADPESEFAKAHAAGFAAPYLKPCAPPGTWTHVVRSERVLGGAIWASLDDTFYFADGKRAGYSWHHGFWGLIDCWRRPKPEWWLAKMVFSPVWFPRRTVERRPDEISVRIPVENRHAFTDLGELTFAWELGGRRGTAAVRVPPGASGSIEVPVPADTAPGEKLVLRVADAKGDLVTAAAVRIGSPPPVVLPEPMAGAPACRSEGNLTIIEGDRFALVFDAAAGDLVPADRRHRSAVTVFPSPHLTRYDFGDLAGAHGKPYAAYPDRKTRVVERAAVTARPEGIEIEVREKYDVLAGSMTWLIDRAGVGRIRWDYAWTGEETDTREAGARIALRPACERLRWRRWSEWGDIFPEDSICRTEGTATAFRPGARGPDREGVRPDWPWSRDATELGTADFRSVKFNVYAVSLAGPGEVGLRVRAKADLHARAQVAGGAVLLHVLSRCPLGQVTVRKGDRLAGACAVELLAPIERM